jgi:lipid-A-disaccharide synthase
MNSIFFLTGETSGDILASQVITQLQKKSPKTQIAGVCGPRMRAQGVKEVAAMEKFMTLFPFSILFASILFYRAKKVQKHILAFKPEVCVFVDASWFSFKMAEWLRESGYHGKIFKYVCPNMYWPDHGRQKKLTELFDGLISIFPGEIGIFANTRLSITYLGHPFLLSCQQSLTHSLKPKQQILSIFPGSRVIEIKMGFKKLLSASLKFKLQYPHVQIAISCASSFLKEAIVLCVDEDELDKIQLVDTFDEEGKYQLMQKSIVALAKPGTNNLELAWLQIPTLVAFPLPRWLRWVVKKFAKKKRKNYSLVNYLHGEEIFPEVLISESFSSENVILSLKKLFFDVEYREHIKNECQLFAEKFKNPHPDKTVSDVLLEWIQTPST